MSESINTLAGYMLAVDKNAAEYDLSDTFNQAPFLATLAAGNSSADNQHKYRVYTGDPTISFRDLNAGAPHSWSQLKMVQTDLKILSTNFHLDRQEVDKQANPDEFVLKEAGRHLARALFATERQAIYGTQSPGLATGFTGILDGIGGIGDDMVVNAGGTTANTASSVYAVYSPLDLSGFAIVMNNGGRITIGDREPSSEEDSSGNKYPSYYVTVEGWLGVQYGSKYHVGRICNITEDSGKGLTDSLLFDLLGRFKGNIKPTAIVMSSRSREQLRKSRTATNATGAPAPIPDNIDGVPIIKSESVINTEPIEQAPTST